ncbi:2,3-diaminopropionate biosynthesis protein SbnB [Flavobacteriaceae bacterium M23B6Z8]
MKYLDEKSLLEVGIDWEALTDTVEAAVVCLYDGETSQPIKPYLRFKDLKNRIISMPAYIGNDFDVAGIKWIASFPDNIHKGIPRAHSVTILNDANTGQPISIINTPLVSVIRTVSVTRLLMRHYFKHHTKSVKKVGMTGFGPIGKYHLDMLLDFFKDTDTQIYIYDLKGIDPENLKGYSNVTAVNSWQEAYEDADVFVTCTVSSAPYIDLPPKKDSLHLNISLRDYKAEMINHFKGGMIVDKWEEICRENTDIENMHLKFGLQKEDTSSIEDVVINDCIKEMITNGPVMFNPMGMSIFDMAVAKSFLDKAEKNAIGLDL